MERERADADGREQAGPSGVGTGTGTGAGAVGAGAAGPAPAQPWLPPEGARLGLWHTTAAGMPFVGPALRGRIVPVFDRAGVDGYVGWGRQFPARLGRWCALIHRRPFWTLEDGLLRSVGLGKSGEPPISVIADDLGIHFDARTPSRIERIALEADLAAHAPRAARLREAVLGHRLSKYNHLPDRPVALPPPSGRRLLLIDQVRGDYSIVGACAGASSFAAMLDAALAVPGAEVVIRGHPDVLAGYARGYLSEMAAGRGLSVLADAVAPHAVLDAVDEVWTVSSQMGFDALMRALPVRCFGVPFYAGYGLTRDTPATAAARAALVRRAGRRLALDELVAAALLLYPVYVEPGTDRRITPEEAVGRLARARHAFAARSVNASSR